MTRERLVSISTPIDSESATLIDDIASAAARAQKADPGDRHDIIRFEALSAQLETWAFAQIGKPNVEFSECDPPIVPPPAFSHVVRDADRVVVTLVLPLEPGDAPKLESRSGVRPPSQPWRSPDGARGRKAVEQRFEAQVMTALNPATPPGAERLFAGRHRKTQDPGSFGDAQDEVAADERPSYLEKSADSARMGKAAEYLVAASCILATHGQLNVSTSIVDDEGVEPGAPPA